MFQEKRGKRHAVDLLFSLALFCVFAASLLMVSATGSQVYENIAQDMENNYTLRTSLSYVTEKLRQNDASGVISLAEIAGEPAVVLEMMYNDVLYQTWIYEYEGKLRELFTRKGNNIFPEDGQALMEIRDFSIEAVKDNLYQITIINKGGKTENLLFSIRSQV